MEHHSHHEPSEETTSGQASSGRALITFSVTIAVLFIAGAWVYARGMQQNALTDNPASKADQTGSNDPMEELVIPKRGLVLPITWGDLGKRLVAAGVIDEQKFKQLYTTRGGLTTDEVAMLDTSVSQPVVITRANANVMLNQLWAYGLAQKSPILEQGEMTNPNYGGAGNFASTGGWTLARGSAMVHYSKHELITLTPDQWALVDRVSRTIYRPCCGNSTHFPDCNHGMAMLGLLELMAANNVSEPDMYRIALQTNAYWFPDTYLTIAKYLKLKGSDWAHADPKMLLGVDYSSAQGYQRILSVVQPATGPSSGGCGA